MALTCRDESATGQMAGETIAERLRGLLGGGLSGQIIRYAMTGAAVTALQAAVYWTLAQPLKLDPQLANFCGYLVAVVTGFVAHGRFSFAGHGGRDRPAARALRFIAASLVSYALNAFWVWLCVARGGLPVWSPIPLMALVTPAVVFILNRQWVFR